MIRLNFISTLQLHSTIFLASNDAESIRLYACVRLYYHTVILRLIFVLREKKIRTGKYVITTKLCRSKGTTSPIFPPERVAKRCSLQKEYEYDFIFACRPIASHAHTLLQLLLTLIYNGPLYIDTMCVSWCNMNRLLAFTSDALRVQHRKTRSRFTIAQKAIEVYHKKRMKFSKIAKRSIKNNIHIRKYLENAQVINILNKYQDALSKY